MAREQLSQHQAVVDHAREDMAVIGQQGRITERPPEGFGAWVKSNHAQMPSLRGQLAAMFREGIKDIRGTMNEFFFGRPEHAPEPGTPGNPTQIQVTQEQGNFHGYDAYHGAGPESYARSQPFQAKALER